MPVTYSGCLGDWFTGLGAKTFVAKKYFKFSSFSCVCFNKKYVEIMINHFTMRLIILKWFRRQKCSKKRKNNEIKRG